MSVEGGTEEMSLKNLSQEATVGKEDGMSAVMGHQRIQVHTVAFGNDKACCKCLDMKKVSLF